MDRIIAKYDRAAEAFSIREYANLAFYMHRRLTIVTSWGTALQPGDSVLEIGCGDGYLAQLLAQYGLCYRGVDISPQMVRVAEQRLKVAGLPADFLIANINQMSLTEAYDAIVALMRTFFAYVHDPLALLKRLRPYVQKKIMIDLNPRRDIPVREAVALLKQAGFQNVAWRPFFVPKARKLPVGILKMLVVCEDVPLLRNLLLCWKFHVVLKGEV